MADRMVNIRCAPELHARIEAEAKRNGLKVSSWIRHQIQGILDKRKTSLDRSRRRA